MRREVSGTVAFLPLRPIKDDLNVYASLMRFNKGLGNGRGCKGIGLNEDLRLRLADGVHDGLGAAASRTEEDLRLYVVRLSRDAGGSDPAIAAIRSSDTEKQNRLPNAA